MSESAISGSEANSASLGDMYMGRVAAVLETIRPGQSLNAAARLADSGFSSIDMVRVMLDIEAEFDLMIPQEEINPENFMSVSSIAALMRRLTSG